MPPPFAGRKGPEDAAPPPRPDLAPAPGSASEGGAAGAAGGTPLGGLPDPDKAARARAAAIDRASRQRLRGLIRDIREDAQRILKAAGPIQAALKLTDQKARDAEVAKAIKDFGHVAAGKVNSIQALQKEARTLLNRADAVYDAIGDAVTALDNDWEAVKGGIERIESADSARAASIIGDMETDIADLLWQAAIITMPPRVNDHLVTLSVGDELDFAEAFSDELPNAPARRRMLSILKSHPGSVTGEVDVDHGVIYKSGKLPRRLVSYGFLLLLIGPAASLFIGLITTGSSLLSVPQALLFPASRHDEMWVAYIAIVGGVLVHLLVESIKQAQRSTDQAFLALGHWLIWIHVREMSLAVTVLTMWIVTVALGLNMTKVDPATAFFAGYSIDSVIGVILTRFDGLAKTSDDALLKRLRPTEAATASAATVTVPTG